MPRRQKPPAPVDVTELKVALLQMIVDKFDGRPLDVETATAALACKCLFSARAREPRRCYGSVGLPSRWRVVTI
jgi:hypothetical protein